MPTKTLKVRIKDKHRVALLKRANAVNFVWNYINDLSNRSIKEHGKFLSGFDLQKYTKGANKELGLHSQTVQMVGAEYATRRKQFKKSKLSWRKSFGVRRSLGWIPLNGQSIEWKNGQLFHDGCYFSVWDSYGLSKYQFKSSCFVEDARGRWYFCAVVEAKKDRSKGKKATGIDLGCKESATDSNAEGITGREYRKLEQKLGIAQRARNKKQVKTIHAKIKNRRHDAIHQYSRKLVNENAAIFVGNVSSQAMIKTKLSKSVLDAGWGTLKTTLKYKCENAGVVFGVVNEAYTTQACSCCGCISHNSPKGRAGLEIREWTCTECGTTHDRDVNAAKNILRVGLDSLAGESPSFSYGE